MLQGLGMMQDTYLINPRQQK